MSFGPLSELTKDFTPERRAEIDAIKAEMQREEDRRAATGSATPGPRERESARSAATSRPAGALGPQEHNSTDERPPRNAPEGR